MTKQEVQNIIDKLCKDYVDSIKTNKLGTPRASKETLSLGEKKRRFLNELDKELRQKYDDVREFIKTEHSEVYWNSTWTNCTDYESILRQYHGVGPHNWNVSKVDLTEEFVPSKVTKKEIILEAYHAEMIRLEVMRDVQAAGDIDTSYLDTYEIAIKNFLQDVASRNDDLTLSV